MESVCERERERRERTVGRKRIGASWVDGYWVVPLCWLSAPPTLVFSVYCSCG